MKRVRKPQEASKARGTCKNPSCGDLFIPGHYGTLQNVCSGSAPAKCGKCRGAGRKDGTRCPACQGKGKVDQKCSDWYRAHWARMRRPPRGIPKETWAKILHQAVRDGSVLWSAFLVVARESGLRKGELLGLTKADLIAPSGELRTEILVRGQWDDRVGFKPTKTSEPRPAYLTSEAKRALGPILRRIEDGGARIFPWAESDTWRRFTSLQRKLGIANPDTGRPYRVHDIRHSLGKELARKGRLDLAKVMLGHKKIETTLIYSELGAEEIVSDIERVRKGR